jgi:type I restriction enzyme M protein
MQWVYETYGEAIYTDIKSHEKTISDWCEKQELNLNAKQLKTLTTEAIWKKQLDLMTLGQTLMTAVGTDEYNDFNLFKDKVAAVVKANKLKVSASELNAIYNAISWYDADAEKVITNTTKLAGDKLEKLLAYLDCKVDQLADYGYFPTTKKGEFTVYETESDLRDTENIPLKENIHDYFVREVQPHVAEAWINLDATKIGYEISFNKYFYQHKPLRAIEEVTADILALEQQSDGLIAEILNLV